MQSHTAAVNRLNNYSCLTECSDDEWWYWCTNLLCVYCFHLLVSLLCCLRTTLLFSICTWHLFTHNSSCTTHASYQYYCMVRTAGRYLRWTHVRSCTRPMVSAYAAWHQMVTICMERWCTKANEATQAHCYNPVAPLTLFGHIMCMDDNADAKRILLASPPAD